MRHRRALLSVALALIAGGAVGYAIRGRERSTPATAARARTLKVPVRSPAQAFNGEPSPCSAHSIRLAVDEERISRMTEESGNVLTLVNRSRTTCLLKGTPEIKLYDGRRLLPFVYRVSAGRPGRSYTSKRAARVVVLPPGASAYFFAGKFACATGVVAEPSEIVIRLPGSQERLHLATPHNEADLAYCRYISSKGRVSPGRLIDISAITAREGEVFDQVSNH